MKTIIVRTQYNGFVHHYPDAPIEVAFLQSSHRHTLMIEVEIEVFHNERDLEFYTVQDYIDYLMKDNSYNSGVSCEAVAERMVLDLGAKYGNHRFTSVAVFEDGINGAKVTSRQ